MTKFNHIVGSSKMTYYNIRKRNFDIIKKRRNGNTYINIAKDYNLTSDWVRTIYVQETFRIKKWYKNIIKFKNHIETPLGWWHEPELTRNNIIDNDNQKIFNKFLDNLIFDKHINHIMDSQ